MYIEGVGVLITCARVSASFGPLLALVVELLSGGSPITRLCDLDLIRVSMPTLLPSISLMALAPPPSPGALPAVDLTLPVFTLLLLLLLLSSLWRTLWFLATIFAIHGVVYS